MTVLKDNIETPNRVGDIVVIHGGFLSTIEGDQIFHKRRIWSVTPRIGECRGQGSTISFIEDNKLPE